MCIISSTEQEPFSAHSIMWSMLLLLLWSMVVAVVVLVVVVLAAAAAAASVTADGGGVAAVKWGCRNSSRDTMDRDEDEENETAGAGAVVVCLWLLLLLLLLLMGTTTMTGIGKEVAVRVVHDVVVARPRRKKAFPTTYDFFIIIVSLCTVRQSVGCKSLKKDTVCSFHFDEKCPPKRKE